MKNKQNKYKNILYYLTIKRVSRGFKEVNPEMKNHGSEAQGKRETLQNVERHALLQHASFHDLEFYEALCQKGTGFHRNRKTSSIV